MPSDQKIILKNKETIQCMSLQSDFCSNVTDECK